MRDAALAPLAADAQHAVGRRDRDAVAQCAGEFGLGLGDRVAVAVPRDDMNRVVINLGRRAAVGQFAPRHAVGEVRAAGDDERVIVYPAERSGHTESAGQIGQRLPLKLVFGGQQGDAAQRQQVSDSEKHGCLG